MIAHVLILGLLLTGADGPRGAAAKSEAAADRITLRDGSVVLGLVTSATSGARGSVEFLVRRDWAEKNLEDHLARWDQSTLAGVRRGGAQRAKTAGGLAEGASGLIRRRPGRSHRSNGSIAR